MKYNPRAFGQGLPASGIKLAQNPKSILIYGDFNTELGVQQVEIIRLASALIDKGHTVETVSPSSSPLAKWGMNYRTPVKFAKSKAFLKRYDHVIIVLPNSASQHFRSTHIWGKTKEWFRINLFLSELLHAGRQVHLVGKHAQNVMAQLLCLSQPLKYKHGSDPSGKIYSHIVGEPLPATDLFGAQDTLFDHAHFSDADQRMSPRTLRRYLSGRKSTDELLLKLCDMASDQCLRQTSVVKLLRNTNATSPPHIKQSTPPYPLLNTAMELDKSNNLPKYASHLINVFKVSDRFDLSSSLGRTKAMNWYNSKAREKMPHYWVPTLSGEAERPNGAKSENQTTAAFLNSFEQGALNDLSLEKLLLTKRDPKGPTAMAILLAILCRIPVGLQTQKNPWKSHEITRWFAQAPVLIAPHLRQFASPSSKGAKQHKFAEISGFTDDATGLACNMKMSRQIIDKICLCYTMRDVETAKSPTYHKLNASDRIKSNFAIHHVNADRIPMVLMTPEKAFRNDIYNIGYFLWETSKVPDAHHLGMEMVDEIWAPTQFVANLYQDAGATNVLTVSKAIPELPYLKKLSNIYLPDPKKFTFISAFDFHSSVERKNPMAVVKAFQNTFPKSSNKNVRLILKSTPSTAKHWGDPNGQMQQIRNAAQKDDRIQLIEKMLPLEYLFKLIATADCIVSAHRGEGFGYFPAYALGLAKPTIVTDWGGVTDFCNCATSFPVKANLVDVPDGHSIYPAKGAQWADIDIHDLGENMRAVFEHPNLAKQRGLAGQQLVQDAYSLDRLANTYETRLKQIGLL